MYEKLLASKSAKYKLAIYPAGIDRHCCPITNMSDHLVLDRASEQRVQSVGGKLGVTQLTVDQTTRFDIGCRRLVPHSYITQH